MLKKDVYKFTNSQKNILDTELFFDKTTINNIGGYVFFEEQLNFDCLEQAINIFVKKNDAFRLKVKSENGELYQYLDDYSFFKINIAQLNNKDEVEQFNQNCLARPFTLLDSDLFYFTLFKLPNGFGGFNVTSHHLISDAWSMSLLVSEIMDLYSKLITKTPIDDSNYPSYIDYIKSNEDYMNSPRFIKDASFWNSLFDQEPEITPISTKNKNNLSTISKRLSFKLSGDLLSKINNFCKSKNCSVYTFFMAIYSIYLAKINNTQDSIIGTPVLNRSGFKEKHTSGMFISTVPFKVNVDRELTFKDFLNNVLSTQMSIFKHQKYPYSNILNNLKDKYNFTENLFDLALSYQNAKESKEHDDIKHYIKWVQNGHSLQSLEVHFFDMNDTGNFDIYYDYQINKFSRDEVEALHYRILDIANEVIKTPDVHVKDISILSNSEKDLILNDFNNNCFEYDKNDTPLKIFEENVTKHPSDISVVFENKKYTYKQLNNMANKLANYILSMNIPENSVIGVKLNRSIYTVVCMLAILKANCAYMLIEKDLPEDRIIYMLQNAKSPLLILSNNVNDVDFANKLYIEDLDFNSLNSSNPDIKENKDNYLSVVYTSGSTGTPKGILVKKYSMVNLVNGYKLSMQTDLLSNFLSICSVSFDMFAAEVWICLLSGKKLILANEEEAKNPILMSKLIEKQNAEFMLITPSKLDLLLSNENTRTCLKHIKATQIGGEVLTPNFYEKVRKYTNAKIYDGYGPSETTSCCSCKFVTSSDDINIGKPLCNAQIYICNKDLNLCPIGVTGELCISGDGISFGYINNLEATNKAFINNPFGNGIMYKSGDLARWTASGDIEYIGRNDFQIKIRGLRVELEEINNAIKKLDGIDNSVTIVRKINNIDTICSFVVSKNKEPEEIKKELNNHLPHYMIPTHIVILDELPLTKNGKIDNKNLPEIDIKVEYVEPKTDTQKTICKLFEEFLNIKKVGITNNFFDLGGDSLIAIKLMTKIDYNFNVELKIKDIFTHTTVEQLSAYIDSLKNSKNESLHLTKVNKQDYYPLSSAQKRIFYTVNMDKDAIAYNTPGGIIFNGYLDTKKLEKCINKIIKRHVALRTYFVFEKNDVKQKVLDNLEFKLETVKTSYSNLDELFNVFVRPFDLTKAPLFRMKYVKFWNGKSILFSDFHHIICDGSSISIFIDELCKLYNEQSLEDIEFDYIDYSTWEENYFKTKSFEESENFWLGQYKDELPVLSMPTTYKRGNTYSFEGAKIYKTISDSDKILDLCKSLNTTPYMFLLTIYYVLLYKYTSQTDIIVGTPIVGRNMPELENIIGMFVNTLALRNKVDPKGSFAELLNEISTNCLNCFEHQTYPFDKLIEKLNIKRDINQNPLFDTMFVYQNEGNREVKLGKISSKYYMPDNKTSKFDFLLEIVPENNRFSLNLEYCTSLFSDDFMHAFLEHYINILNSVIENIDIQISDICILSLDEKNKLLNLWNDNYLEYQKDLSIIELFEKQVAKTPESIALIYDKDKLTYRELKNKVDIFSSYLYNKGIKKGDFVGTLLDRSSSLIISMLAIMKCGAIYLPISKKFPEERIRYIIQNSKLKTLIVDNSYHSFNYAQNIINIDKINMHGKKIKFNVKYSPDDVIYTIYTSGSTGNPKGVLVKNENLNNFIASFNKLFDYSVNNNDICLATTSISFDVSIWEFFFTLLNGATLYLYKNDTIEDIFDFCKTLHDEKITMAYLPPNILNEVYQLLSKYENVDLQKILVGVEPIKISTISKYYSLNPNMKIVNGYGPTETTICSTAFVVNNIDYPNYHILPIGKPLYNLNAYVLDKDLNPVPLDVSGELYISGPNVTKGYLNNEDLTNEKYIKCPFNTSERMYSTGDVVKIMPDKNILFIGRNDNQIKINGHRIELNEIASTISTYPSITKSFVIVKTIGANKSLVAYFTADKKVILNDLRSFLSLKLPFFSIPNLLVQLDKFVLTPNGKVDKKYLESLEVQEFNNYEAPRNEFEEKLASLWQKYLNVKKVGINDNFFDLGGDSLIAIRLQIEAFDLGLNISYADIFSHPTIKQLSSKVSLHSSDINITNYDYSKIDKLLGKNKLPIIKKKSKKTHIKAVLLTGVTGFVGIHILDNLLRNTNATIYCLVRDKNHVSYTDRLAKTLNFYFKDKYTHLIGKRIKLLKGDITQKHLGLKDNIYNSIGKEVCTIINSAAIVKHYGNSSSFDNTNIKGVKNIIEFCRNFNIKLYHLSTLSVSGNVFAEDGFKGSTVDKKTDFEEYNLYVNQDISNVYVYTKFMAERIILENVQNHNITATIIRLGNITNRYKDGKFQINISENAFLSRLISFIKLGCIPDYLLEGYGEFSPVDYVANAIVKIVKNNPDYTVFHLFNNNHIPLGKMIKIFNKYGLHIDILPEKEFLKVIDKTLKEDKSILSGIINDFDNNKKLVYDSNIILKNDFTNEFLSILSFKWCKIDKRYIYKYLNYLKEVGYLGGT